MNYFIKGKPTRNKRGPNVTPAEHKLVVKFAKECLRLMCKKEFELTNFSGEQIKYADAVKKLSVTTKCRGQASHGGTGGITIDLTDFRAGGGCFEEYDSYANSPLIGSITGCFDSELLLKAEVAHEVAHHIQDAYGPHSKHLKSTYRKSHGEAFKAIYGELRRVLINPYIDSLFYRNKNSEVA